MEQVKSSILKEDGVVCRHFEIEELFHITMIQMNICNKFIVDCSLNTETKVW